MTLLDLLVCFIILGFLDKLSTKLLSTQRNFLESTYSNKNSPKQHYL